MYPIPRTPWCLAAVVAFGLSVDLQALPVAITTPNTNTPSGPVSVTLNGTTFSNLGLQGVGRISATGLDQFGDSYGSVSSMSIANWKKTRAGYSGSFYTLPDRGFNGGTFFSDYAARLQRVDFKFTPYVGAAPIGGATLDEQKAAQNQIVATYVGGKQLTLPGGSTTTGLDPLADFINFLGADLPYVPTGVVDGVEYPVQTVALDAEGLFLKPDGSGYVSDEYGPAVYYFNKKQQIVGIITPPPGALPHSPAGVPNFSSATDPVNGRRGNQGFEGVGLTPDGNTLFVALQSATIQDSGAGSQGRFNTRIFAYDVSQTPTPSTPIAEYVLQLPIVNDNGNGKAPNKTAAQSELLVLSDCQLLVLSRDSNGLGSGSAKQAVFKSVLLVDLSTATDIAGSTADLEGGQVSPGGVLLPTVTPVSWIEAVNLLNLSELAKFNINVKNDAPDSLTLSEKWEAMALVPALDRANPNDYFLFVANDNDFLTSNGTMRQADGAEHAYDAVGTNPLLAESDTIFLAYRVRITPDSIPPVITSLSASPSVLASDDERSVLVTIDAVASDNCSLKRLRVVNVTTLDPRAPNDRDTGSRIVGDLQVRLEPTSEGDGRIYRITVEATDAAGNRSRSTVDVTVPARQEP